MMRYLFPSFIIFFGVAIFTTAQQPRFLRPLQNYQAARQATVCVDGVCYQQPARSIVVHSPVAIQTQPVVVQPRPVYQAPPSPTVAVTQTSEVRDGSFRSAILEAAIQAANKNEIKRVDVLRLRVASLAPAFQKRAEDLAVAQAYYHEGDLQMTSDGVVDRASIDWQSWIPFLIKLMPFIIELLRPIG